MVALHHLPHLPIDARPDPDRRARHPLFDLGRLWEAYQACRRGKRRSWNAMAFEAQREDGLVALREELRLGTWQPRPSRAFLVTRPKRREVFAADFRDRIVHHLLVGHLEPAWERRFIHDSYACRVGKGTHAGVDRLQAFTRQATANGTRSAWYLQLDIRGFFMAIDRQRLYRRLARHAGDPVVRDLIARIVFHDPVAGCRLRPGASVDEFLRLPPHKTLFRAAPGCGLPIGNLTSQFFANVYLDALDQFVKHHLRATWYVRYCDDLVCLLRGFAPTAFQAYPRALSQLDSVGRPPESWRHRLRRLYAATVARRPPHRARWGPMGLSSYDLVLLHQDPATLAAWREAIVAFVDRELGLHLHPRQRLRPIADGIDFLGYVIRPQYRLVRRRVLGALHLDLRRLAAACSLRPLRVHASVPGTGVWMWQPTPPVAVAAAQARLESFRAHAARAASHRLCQGLATRYPGLARVLSLGPRDQPWRVVAPPATGAQAWHRRLWLRAHLPEHILVVRHGARVLIRDVPDAATRRRLPRHWPRVRIDVLRRLLLRQGHPVAWIAARTGSLAPAWVVTARWWPIPPQPSSCTISTPPPGVVPCTIF